MNNIFSKFAQGKLHWINILKIRNAFLPKALLVISLFSFLLSNFPTAMKLLTSTTSLKLIFLGSIIYFLGYVISSVSLPSEFQDSTSLIDAASRFRQVSFFTLFEDRRELLRIIIKRFSENKPYDMNVALLIFARRKYSSLQKIDENQWKNYSNDLFYTDLNLRQYDKPVIRTIIMVMMIGGIILMIAPTVFNVFTVAFS